MQARRFLNNFFSCHSKIDILRTVINSDEPQSGRQIAAKAGLSPRSCQLSLDELVRLNALNRREAGKAYYYTANVENLIVTDLVIPIIQQEERLTVQVVDDLRSYFKKNQDGFLGIYYLESWPRSWGGKGLGAILFTVMREGKKAASMEKKLKELCELMLQYFGIPADFKIFSQEEFKKLVLEKAADVSIISYRLKDVIGERFEDLLRKERGNREYLRRAVDFFPKRGRRSR